MKSVWVFIAMAGFSAGPNLSRAAQTVKALQVPSTFPHRIWAACDFEGRTRDYGWFGHAETNSIPKYPGNRTALRANPGPYEKHSALMAGVNPVPGPRMGKENWLYLRYFLKGGNEAILQHFSLTSEDNWHVNVGGLKTGQWAELAVNFNTHARRNDGSNKPFGEGERMDDFKMFAGRPEQAGEFNLLMDDVIFFANDPALPPEPEPFPNRVIFVSAFDTGEKEKYWPGDFDIVEEGPKGAHWRVARGVAKGQMAQIVSLPIDPPRPVGARTKLRFRYYLSGANEMVVQIFDATVQDNRHVVLRNLTENQWQTVYVDFARESKRNDGTPNAEFTAGNLIDDLFFFIPKGKGGAVTFYLDEVVLFDGRQ